MDSPRTPHDLQRFWEAIALGRPAAPGDLDPDLAALVQRLHTTPDVPPPDATYARHLREYLMHTPSASLSPAIGPPFNGRVNTPPPRGLFPPLLLPQRRGQAWPVAQVAMVLLLIAAMTALIFMVSLRPHGQPAMAPGVATPLPTASGDWPMYRANPGRSGTTSGSGPDGQPVITWTYHADGSAARSPAVVGGVVYSQTGDGMVTALDASTGQVLWQNGETGTFENTPAIAGDTLYLTLPSGNLAALATKTGVEKWRFGQALAPECMPVVLDGVVYMGSDDGKVYAVDAATGEERWQSTISGPVWRSLAVGGGMIYAGTSNGRLDALDLATGEARWQFAGDDDAQSIGTPTFADGVVYVNYAGSMYALDSATGEQHWSKSFEGSRPATVANGMIFTGGLDGTVYAIDAATGEDRWTFATKDEIQAAPVYMDGVLYVAGFDRILYALDAATGSELWSIDLDGAVVFGPSIAGGMIFVGTDAGTLFALGGSGTTQLTAPQAATATVNAAATSPDATPDVSASTTGIVNGEGPAIGLVSFVMNVADPANPIHNAGGVGVAPDGTLYVVDILNNQVHAFNADGTPRTVWGRRGDGPGEFQFNQGDFGFGDVKVGPDGAVYVAERQGSRIQKFTPDGTFIASWGERGSEPGQFNDPNSLTITPAGEIMVADTGNARIQVFDQDGNLLRVWGEAGTLPGKLREPWKAIVRPNGTILVADIGLQVFAFDQEGVFLGTAVADDPTNTAPDSTYGLDVDAAGNIYMNDFVNNRIIILAPDLTRQAAWGAEGTGDGEFQGPNDLVLDQQGRLYVSDEKNYRVQVFQIAPLAADASASTMATPAP